MSAQEATSGDEADPLINSAKINGVDLNDVLRATQIAQTIAKAQGHSYPPDMALLSRAIVTILGIDGLAAADSEVSLSSIPEPARTKLFAKLRLTRDLLLMAAATLAKIVDQPN